jgi:DnaJ like chaperone protein
MAIAADGEIHPNEHDMLVRVLRRLRMDEAGIARLEALLRGMASHAAAGGPPPKHRLEDAYAVLGVSPTASDAQVKRAYRKLISDNHPDKLASKGLPESMREVAESRAREINAAYDVVKKARGTA